ncbi:hypothetical protein FE257_011101 [Aspergillus nanangensis]|uniref:O-methyltransferase C-terminal domain-containing protein n=1 Tax=Aspergillus nanangensis TaxID=2582783 RepID=A0AAD4GQU7_ASPNN|nr:hypothetical protein FE257_011101 [Aspergillus nanangensis]
MSTLRELVSILSKNVELYMGELDNVGSHLDDANLALLGSEGLAARDEIIIAAEKLLQHARGPGPALMSLLSTASNIGTIQTLIRLEVPDHVPSPGSITYDALITKLKTPVKPGLLQRLVRFARFDGFLDEDEAGAVKHTPMSAIFVRDQGNAVMAKLVVDFLIQPILFMYESITLDPSGENPRQAPFAVMARGSGAREGPTPFEILEKDQINRDRFHDGLALHSEFMIRHVSHAYDWNSVQSLIDVGGSQGHVATVIAEAFPHIHITVQDRPEVIQRARQRLDQNPRLTFEEHDFFVPQPRIADAYLLRQVLHDWNDADCTRIICQICSAMRPSARLLVMDAVLPEPGEGSLQIERQLRGRDIIMYVSCAAKERSLAQIRRLVENCDRRLRFEKVYTPSGSSTGMLSWIYE